MKCIADEVPFELPQGWAWSRGYCCFEGMKSTKPQGKYFYYIDIDSIDNKLHKVIQPKKMPTADAPSRASRALKNGSVLFALVRPYLENIALVFPDLSHCIASTGFYVCNSTGTHLPKFLFNLMTSNYVIAGLNQFMKGDNSPSISKDNIEHWLYPVPPLAEQKRIAEKIDELLSLVEKISVEKNELNNLSFVVKSKCLDHAIRGKLVPQDPNDEPASVLLERIRVEKEELIKQGKIKRDKKESVIFKGEDNSYYERIGDKVSKLEIDYIPNGWSVASFSQLNLFVSESLNPSTQPDEIFELYSVPNFELKKPEIVSGKEIGSTKQSIFENDILVCKINPRINRVWITKHTTSYRILGSSEWMVFRNHLIFAPYLQYYFSSSYFRDLLLSNVSGVGGSLMRAQPESVKKYPILLPPFQEQIRIAARIDKLFGLLATIEYNLN